MFKTQVLSMPLPAQVVSVVLEAADSQAISGEQLRRRRRKLFPMAQWTYSAWSCQRRRSILQTARRWLGMVPMQIVRSRKINAARQDAVFLCLGLSLAARSNGFQEFQISRPKTAPM